MAPVRTTVSQVGLRWRAAGWIAGAATLAFLIFWLAPMPPVGLGLKTYAPLHTLLEVFAVGVAGAIFAVGWHGRLTRDTHTLSIVGAGFFAVALLDTAHLLSYAGMPDWITPSSPGKAINFWFGARYAAAVSLLVLVMAKSRTGLHPARARAAVAIAVAYAAIACWIVLGHGDSLPVFIEPGRGLTPIKIAMEWGLVSLCLLAMAFVWRRRAQDVLYDPASLLLALWLTILSELCFTLYSSVSDMFNILGHAYKVLSYGFLYQALVVGSVKLPYKLLAESQGLLQQLTDNIRQVFWMASPDKRQMLYISPAYESIWGRSCASLLAAPESWLDSIHPDDRPRVSDQLKNQVNGAYNVEYRIVRPDGAERWIHDQAFPVRDASGHIQRVAGMAEDISEQKQAETALATSEARLQRVLRGANDGAWDWNLKTNYVNYSPRWQSMLGYREGELEPNLSTWKKLCHPDDAERALQLVQEHLDGVLPTYEVEFRMRHKDGHWVHILSRGAVERDEAGMPLILSGTHIDITERKRAEAEHEKLHGQLLQAQKMESIGHLTGGIAHDFNNMLGAIIGYSELLKQACADVPNAARSQKYIGEILTAGNRAKELIAQMLVFSRLSPSTPESEAPITLLKPVIKEVVRLLCSSIPSTIEVNYHIPDEELRARIQPVQLHQILLNLAINARDAIDEYGRIDITLVRGPAHGSCDSCHQDFSGEYVDLCVNDTGRGIPEDVLPHVFDPFFTTKEVGKGTGMGLPVVHGVVHALGGHIAVASQRDHGTTIRILLPTVAADAASPLLLPATDMADAAGMLAGLRIMVVDDEHAMASMLQEMLSIHGAQVTACHHPAEALAAFVRNPDGVDLVITDESMPDLSGLDLAKGMLQMRPGLPVILCTGYSEHANADIAKQNGIAGFMTKPLELDKLLRLIQTLREAPGP